MYASDLRIRDWSREEAEARAKKALEQVGLDPSYYKQSPFELSGGMKQRVGIAMSMTARPRLLLADELLLHWM